jgi:3D (Asp-Asp-Asp) domain-containing protein
MYKGIKILLIFMLITSTGIFPPNIKSTKALEIPTSNSKLILLPSLAPLTSTLPTAVLTSTVVAKKVTPAKSKTVPAKSKPVKAKVSRSKVVTRSSPPVMVVSFEISAYSPRVIECDGDPYTTASGKRVYEGGIATDLSRYPLGTIMIIPNYNNGNPCTVVDSGSAIKKNKIDVFFFEIQKAINWGRRKNVQVKILYLAPK